jgi:hypothetical protein
MEASPRSASGTQAAMPGLRRPEPHHCTSTGEHELRAINWLATGWQLVGNWLATGWHLVDQAAMRSVGAFEA